VASRFNRHEATRSTAHRLADDARAALLNQQEKVRDAPAAWWAAMEYTLKKRRRRIVGVFGQRECQVAGAFYGANPAS
jgi:hypothetical protein